MSHRRILVFDEAKVGFFVPDTNGPLEQRKQLSLRTICKSLTGNPAAQGYR